MINARVESVHEKPAFRGAFVQRRCLLPADGFYEWREIKHEKSGRARKQPYFIHPEDGQVLALAGLYEYWRNPEIKHDDDPAAWLMTCTIITTDATDAAGRIHPPYAPCAQPRSLRRLARSPPAGRRPATRTAHPPARRRPPESPAR